MNHSIQKCPKEDIRAKTPQKSIGQQRLSIDEEFLPIRAGFQQQQTPQTEHCDQIEEETDDSGESHDACKRKQLSTITRPIDSTAVNYLRYCHSTQPLKFDNIQQHWHYSEWLIRYKQSSRQTSIHGFEHDSKTYLWFLMKFL